MIRIEFDTDNAAFADDFFFMECEGILHDLAEQISDGRTGEIPLYDFNGNRVGTAHVSQD